MTTKLAQIRKEMMNEKAAKVLGKRFNQIVKVDESRNGAYITCTNGNRVNVPYEVWVLGMTEQEYIKAKYGK